MFMYLNIIFRTPPERTTDSVSVSISQDDNDIIEYIAGFVLFREKQKAYRLKDSPHKSQLLEIIDSIQEKEAPTKPSLTSVLTRGGLICVKKDILPVFTRLEFLFRVQTPDTSLVTSIPLKDLTEEACQDSRLEHLFIKPLQSLSVSQATLDRFFYAVVEGYFVTRCNGYCRQTIERYRESVHQHKRSKSLRKDLDTGKSN